MGTLATQDLKVIDPRVPLFTSISLGYHRTTNIVTNMFIIALTCHKILTTSLQEKLSQNCLLEGSWHMVGWGAKLPNGQ